MLELVIDQRRRDLGGFEVGRVLPFPRQLQPERGGGNPEKRQGRGAGMVGPFIFFDHLGPKVMPAGISRNVDVRPHPHIGLSTVTYLFDGEIMHRDSVGSETAIRPGEVNWMVAGSGITHSERFERARARGDNVHGIQSWVALPDHDEETAPEFAHHGRSELPIFEDGGLVAIVAKDALSSNRERPPDFIFDQWQRALALPEHHAPVLLKDIAAPRPEPGWRLQLSPAQQGEARDAMKAAATSGPEGRFSCVRKAW